ncbi:MAG: succinyldiaminopimelate transaminase [Candidatus Nanopelagicales bacterium]
MPQLPDFPWDKLGPFRSTAAEYPDGVCDLAIGTPVDPVPELIQAALREHTDTPGYPTTHGTVELREAARDWLANTHGVLGVDAESILPTIGSKEFVAGLPGFLGLGAGDTVAIPEVAYPTYEVGALLAGATPVRADSLTQLGPVTPKLLWINTPSNPTGKVLPIDHLRKVVSWARERGVIVASDECYIDLGWDEKPISILHPDVCDGDFTNLLAVHSLSKRSNLAGYRLGFVTGDSALVAQLLEIRKHSGFMVPSPVQAAGVAALRDNSHVEVQRERYAARRSQLKEALESAGFRIDESAAGLYLWATRDESCWDTLAWLADRGIVVAPGEFYGPRGTNHVRVAMTASDEAVEQVTRRLR